MNTPQSKVTSLELSKELSKFMTVGTEKVWFLSSEIDKNVNPCKEWKARNRYNNRYDNGTVPAYDIADLLEWLPVSIKGIGRLIMFAPNGRIVFGYGESTDERLKAGFCTHKDCSATQALGQLCLWVNESGYGRVEG